jgi:peptidoglycan/LPS O-acetylase OafA/YrhL
MMRSDNRPYIPELDVFRAAAAWWVVMYHSVIRFTPAGQPPYMWTGSDNPLTVLFSQGWLAVSLFVMLSGYSLSLGLNRGTIMWGRYLSARWLRVAPLYLVVLALGTLASVSMPPTAGDFLASVTLLPIPGAFTPGPWLATAWSVRIEFVLYLLIPAFVYAARRHKPVVVAAMGAIIAVVIMVALAPTAGSYEVLYGGLPGRLVEFGAGFVLGWTSRSIARPLRRIAIPVACAGFVVLAYVGNRSGGLLEMSGTTRVAIYVGTLLFCGLLLISVDKRRRTSDSRVMKAVSAVGSWSYSTYLWHAVVINLLVAPLFYDRATPLGFYGSLAAGLAVTTIVVLALSWASFNLIEKPFLTLRPKYVREEEAPARATAPAHAMAPAHGTAPALRPMVGAANPLPHRQSVRD